VSDLQQRQPPGASSRLAWSYVSGRVAALETTLVSRAFFEDVLKAVDVPSARSAAAKTRYREAFPSDDAARAYAEAVTAYGEALAAGILAESPPHPMRRFLELPHRYRRFRGAFLRKAQFAAPPADLEALFDAFAQTQAERDALARHIAMLREKEPPQSADAVGQSIYLDSAAVTLQLAVAEESPEPAVRALLRDRAALAAWSSVLRSRWNGTSAETVKRWFAMPGEWSAFVARTADAAATDPASGVLDVLSRPAAAALAAVGAARIRDDVDHAVGEALRAAVLEARAVPFGPERVLAYLMALEVEQINLRIAMASVVDRIEPSRAAARLRSEYV
jgi:hypothetical protein